MFESSAIEYLKDICRTLLWKYLRIKHLLEHLKISTCENDYNNWLKNQNCRYSYTSMVFKDITMIISFSSVFVTISWAHTVLSNLKTMKA